MRHRVILVSATGVVIAGLAFAQDNGVKAVIGNVFLQNTTPGTPQAGHATITGAFRAGQVFVQQGSTSTIPVVGNSTATGTGTAVGGSFSSAQTSGLALRGTATSTLGDATGVRGESRSPNGFGVIGLSTDSTGAGTGVLGGATSATGYGGLFVGGLKTDNLAVGTAKVPAYSVNVYRSAANGIALSATLVGTFSSYQTGSAGVFFSNRSDYAVGLNGQAAGAGFSTGLYGEAKAGATRYGVYGKSAAAANSWAGYFVGNAVVTGSLSKGGGSFKIDHPLDPENMYLYHSFVESPDMMNIYNGVATTDARGYATVSMPDWFQALNRDFRYQLTVIDTADSADFVQAKVVKEIEGNRFRIRTSKGHARVSWQVTGIRHDKWADANRIPVEERKDAVERGTYLHPKEWGQPERKGRDAKLGPQETASQEQRGP